MAEPLTEAGPLGDKRAEDKAAKKGRTAAQQHDEAIRWVMGDARGRRVVWAQLTDAGVFTLSMDGRGTEWTAFNEGKRALGLKLLGDVMRLAPNLYLTMANEGADDGGRSDPES